jgi:hypothetical protein
MASRLWRVLLTGPSRPRGFQFHEPIDSRAAASAHGGMGRYSEARPRLPNLS